MKRSLLIAVSVSVVLLVPINAAAAKPEKCSCREHDVRLRSMYCKPLSTLPQPETHWSSEGTCSNTARRNPASART